MALHQKAIGFVAENFGVHADRVNSKWQIASERRAE
jgi:hypothetical protein